MTDNRLYRISVRVTISNWWHWETKLIQINELRTWLDEITEWQPDMYELKFHSSGGQCVVWFADEQHAMLCALKYS